MKPVQPWTDDALLPRLTEALVEFPLVLRASDWAALEHAAARQRLTIGQLLRRLVNKYLRDGGRAPEPGDGNTDRHDPR